MYKVSICIPAYEKKDSLNKLLKSISDQSYQDYEVIITDDSNEAYDIKTIPDNIKEKTKYIHNKPSLGPSVNWNKAMSLAKGEYIKMMFDDDSFSEADSLEKFVKMLDNDQGCDLAFSGTWQISKHYKFCRCITAWQLKLLKKNYRFLFLGNYIGAPSATIFRNKKFLFDEELKWLVDVDLYLSILSINNHFTFTTKPLINIGISEEQLTNSCINNKKLNLFEKQYIRKKYKFSFLFVVICKLFSIFFLILRKTILLIRFIIK